MLINYLKKIHNLKHLKKKKKFYLSMLINYLCGDDLIIYLTYL
jgi:hypothetical protein